MSVYAWMNVCMFMSTNTKPSGNPVILCSVIHGNKSNDLWEIIF